MSSYHSHKQLVKPLQLEFSAGPHVRPEGRLHQANTATGQQLSWRPSHIGGIIHLEGEKGRQVWDQLIINHKGQEAARSVNVCCNIIHAATVQQLHTQRTDTPLWPSIEMPLIELWCLTCECKCKRKKVCTYYRSNLTWHAILMRKLTTVSVCCFSTGLVSMVSVPGMDWPRPNT